MTEELNDLEYQRAVEFALKHYHDVDKEGLAFIEERWPGLTVRIPQGQRDPESASTLRDLRAEVLVEIREVEKEQAAEQTAARERELVPEREVRFLLNNFNDLSTEAIARVHKADRGIKLEVKPVEKPLTEWQKKWAPKKIGYAPPHPVWDSTPAVDRSAQEEKQQIIERVIQGKLKTSQAFAILRGEKPDQQ